MKRLVVVVGVCVFVATGVFGAAPAWSIASNDDAELAEAGLLTQADFPAGWTATERPADDGEVEKVAKTIPSCNDYRALRTTTKRQAQAKSPQFELGASQIDNTVTVFPTTAAATAALKVFAKPSVLTCVNKLFTKVFTASIAADPATRKQVDSIDVDIDRASVVPVGDATTAYEGTVTITLKDGTTQTLGVGTAAARTGRGVDTFSYTVDSSDVLPLLQPLVEASVARLTAALA
jgi:hypothetical protein